MKCLLLVKLASIYFFVLINAFAQPCKVFPEKLIPYRPPLSGQENRLQPTTVAYGATLDRPAIFRIRAASFEIGVGSTKRGKTKTQVRRASDADKVECTSSWLAGLYYISVQAKGEEEWLIHVFDEASGGPTGDNPYLATIKFGSPDGLVSLIEQPKPIPAPQGPGGTCQQTKQPLHPSARLEEFIVEDRLSRQFGSLINRYRLSGRRRFYFVVAQAIPKLPKTPKLLLRVYVKQYGDGVFQQTCQQEYPLNIGSDQKLVVAAPDTIFSPLWLVELTCTDMCPVGRIPFTLKIQRELSPDEDKVAMPPNASGSLGAFEGLILATLDYLCYTAPAPGRYGVVPRSGSLFAGTTKLQIDIRPAKTPLSTIKIIRNYLLSAVSLWRRVCISCVPDNLSVILIDNHLFLDSVLADWLFNLDPNNIVPTDSTELISLKHPTERQAFRFYASMGTRVGTRSSAAVYVEMAPNETRWRSLCKVPGAYLPEQILRIKAALPCEAAAVESPLKVELKLSEKGLSCGSSLNLIACEEQNANVELNTRDYAFTSAQTAKVLFGSGRIRVDLMHVLLHELGHWIGLGHTLSATSNVGIMEEYYETASCIENSAFDLLKTVIAESPRPRNLAPSSLKFSKSESLNR